MHGGRVYELCNFTLKYLNNNFFFFSSLTFHLGSCQDFYFSGTLGFINFGCNFFVKTINILIDHSNFVKKYQMLTSYRILVWLLLARKQEKYDIRKLNVTLLGDFYLP